MGFEGIIGQELVLKSLKRIVKSGEIGHAYLFSGPAGSGKKNLALLFAQALNCHNQLKRPCGQCLSCRRITSGNHPDLYILKPQGSSLKIGQLREVKDSLYLLSVEGGKKICIIYDAELMTLPAANSLLKILEEPPGDLVFLLLTARPWDLPATVVSRCTHFSLAPLTGERMKAVLEKSNFAHSGEKDVIMALAGGNPGKGLEMASRGGWEKKYREALLLVENIEHGPEENVLSRAEELARRDDLREILDLLLLIYRDRLVRKLSVPGNELINSAARLNNNGSVESCAGTAKIIIAEEQKTVFSLEKICRALLQLQEELQHNINLRLALEVLFLQMRGAV